MAVTALWLVASAGAAPISSLTGLQNVIAPSIETVQYPRGAYRGGRIGGVSASSKRSLRGGARSARRKFVAAIADRALPLSEHLRYAWKNWRPFHRRAASVTCRNPGDGPVIDNHLSELRASQHRNHADGCVPVLLRLPRLRCTDETETGRLLRVLLIRRCALPSGPTRPRQWGTDGLLFDTEVRTMTDGGTNQRDLIASTAL
jgi:hypothetical protein